MKVERSIHIDAPPQRVWDVIKDVERWPEWTPSTLSVKRNDDGPLRVGSSAFIELRGTPDATWTVTEINEGRNFTWEARSGAGVVVAAGHVVEPDGGGSNVTLSIAPRGPIGTFLSPLIVAMSRKNVEAEAAGLKRHCESVTNAG